MQEHLFKISSNKKTDEFFEWARNVHGQQFNYNIFRRTKDGKGIRTTDRQKLLILLAEQYVTMVLSQGKSALEG